MVWVIVVGVLGLVLGWLIRGTQSPNRRDLAEYDDRAQRAERRLRSVVVERDDGHASALTLRAALRSERQLLDAVANDAGVEPEAFRKTISKEYLGRELVVSPASLVDFEIGTNTAAEAEVETLQQLLRARDAQLAEAREQIHRIRSDVESLALAGGHRSVAAASGPPPPGDYEATLDLRADPAVIDLCESADRSRRPLTPGDRSLAGSASTPRPSSVGPTITPERARFLESRAGSAQLLEQEVASLRARLADTAVSNDDLRSRIDYRRSLDNQLADIVAQLETFRHLVVAEKPPVVQVEDDDAVL